MSRNSVQREPPLSKAKLRVVPNVYAAADHEGRLSAAVRFDPEHGREGSVHFVGATVDRKPIPGMVREKGFNKERGVRLTRYDVTVDVQLKVYEVPHTGYFVRQLKDGGLIAADEATAKLAKIAFLPVNNALAAAKEKLIGELKATHGEERVDGWVEQWPDFTLEAPSPSPAPVTPDASLVAVSEAPVADAKKPGKGKSREAAPAAVPTGSGEGVGEVGKGGEGKVG